MTRQGIFAEGGRAILVYFAATAVTAGVGGAFRAPLPSFIVWILNTLGLFAYVIYAADRWDAANEDVVGCATFIVVVAATGVCAFVGFVLLVNIWIALGIPP